MTTLEKLESMFRVGKITRREFLAKASALGVAAAISPALLSSKAIADKPKKAVQYTTGVTKALKHFAKKDGLTLREYVEKTFNTVYPSSGET